MCPVTPEELSEHPTRIERLALLALAAGIAAVFTVATILKPDGRGYGTHEQLGLPPCEFRALTGFNCPHCGMTTSFAHMVRGQVVQSWNANPSAMVLVPLLVCMMVWSGIVSVSGRWFLTSEPLKYFVFSGITYLVIAILIWVVTVLI